ncbi:hybrid sensor histidine kinase/response regulator [Pantanalinema sp. GBBB05]|uniref:hybrid sensor histidine kinase/response regulator n=1 Tax=Pantanalinema sp. GBBB05 TaxID=2604139 RepID=UPI001DA1D94D|nr:GAF domain-containing protein [Pantanalinema sp. GBBB05]
MPSPQPFTFSRVLPVTCFETLRRVMQGVVRLPAAEVLVITETRLASSTWLTQQGIRQFVLVASKSFSGLLLGRSTTEIPASLDAPRLPQSNGSLVSQELLPAMYLVELWFDPDTIANFLAELSQHVDYNPGMLERLHQVADQLQPNDPTLQSQFTLQLVEAMATNPSQNPTCDLSSDGRAAEKLRQQVEQERLLNQVASQIRKSLELPVILETAVQQLRCFLHADRLVIYQFASYLVTSAEPQRSSSLETEDPLALTSGRITHEARAHDQIPTVLNQVAGEKCFIEVSACREKYRKGSIQAVEDITTTYAEAPCLIQLLQQAKVKAKLVVPIIVQQQLWGLLIAHQCSGTRQWQESEKIFLLNIAEHLAIAIQQTQLYTQLQQQAETLSQHVVERTRDLHDALNAAQSANLAKTEFLSAISHELRTPLTCIIGMAATLLRLPPGAEGQRFISLEKQQDYLRTIQKSGEHLLELINDILDLSQVEAGRTILDIQLFSLSQTANECLRMLKDKADKAEVKLELQLKLKLPSETGLLPKLDQFAADPRRVRQILLNLLSNAIKFTPRGGQVTLSIWREQNHVILQVEDTGIGIAEDQLPLLFKKFQQLDGSYHRRYEGTGLGLALTKQLVELHGGWIEVESTLNLGSTFTVWLPNQPLDKLEIFPTVHLRDESSPIVPGRVVLIHRQEEAATLICNLLTTAGYQVVWIMDGPTAIRQLEILKPIVVVLEIQVAIASSDEVLQQLRQNPTTQNTKILVLLNSRAALNADRWLTEGADDYLTEPIAHPEALLDKVAALAATPGDLPTPKLPP